MSFGARLVYWIFRLHNPEIIDSFVFRVDLGHIYLYFGYKFKYFYPNFIKVKIGQVFVLFRVFALRKPKMLNASSDVRRYVLKDGETTTCWFDGAAYLSLFSWLPFAFFMKFTDTVYSLSVNPVLNSVIYFSFNVFTNDLKCFHVKQACHLYRFTLLIITYIFRNVLLRVFIDKEIRILASRCYF